MHDLNIQNQKLSVLVEEVLGNGGAKKSDKGFMEHMSEIVLSLSALQAEIDIQRESAKVALGVSNDAENEDVAADYLDDYNEFMASIAVLEKFQQNPSVLQNKSVQNWDIVTEITYLLDVVMKSVQDLYEVSDGQQKDISLKAFNTAQKQIEYLLDLEEENEDEDKVIILTKTGIDSKIKEINVEKGEEQSRIEKSANDSQKEFAQKTFKELEWEVNVLKNMRKDLDFDNDLWGDQAY